MSGPARTALVIGINRGIGLEVCRQPRACGWRVFLDSRISLKAGRLLGLPLETSVRRFSVLPIPMRRAAVEAFAPVPRQDG